MTHHQKRWSRCVSESARRLTIDAVFWFAETIGNIATWAIDNPKSAIAAAITASIARAGIESALRSGIESLIGAAGGGGQGIGGYNRAAGFGGGLGVAGNLAAGLTLATLAVTTVVIGTAIIDQLFDESKKKEAERFSQEMTGLNLGGQARAKWESGDAKGAIEIQRRSVEAANKALAESKAKVEDKPWHQEAMEAFWGKKNDPINQALGSAGFNESADAMAKEAMAQNEKIAARQQERLDRMIELLEQAQGAGLMPTIVEQ